MWRYWSVLHLLRHQPATVLSTVLSSRRALTVPHCHPVHASRRLQPCSMASYCSVFSLWSLLNQLRSQSLYILRLLRAHGMCETAIQTIFRSVIIAKLTYGSVLGEDLPKLLTGNELMLSFAGLNDADTTQCICPCLKNCARTLTINCLIKLSRTLIMFSTLSSHHHASVGIAAL